MLTKDSLFTDLPTKQGVAKLRRDATIWIDEAFSVIRSSKWEPALRLGNVDVLEALRAPLLHCVLRLVREDVCNAESSSFSKILAKLRALAYDSRLLVQEVKARRKSAPASPVTVLFWPQLSMHSKEHIPVAKCLSQAGVLTGFVLNQAIEFESVRRQDTNAVYAGRAWPERLRKARQEGRDAANRMPESPGLPLPPFLRDLPEEVLVRELRSTIVQMLPLVHRTVAATKAAIREIKPRVLVVGNDLTLEGRTQCMVAAELQISTACFMHGIVSGEPLQGRHLAHTILVYSERNRQELIDLGEKPARIQVCGAPSLTNRKRQTGSVNSEVKQYLNLVDGQPWILLATSGPGHSVSVVHHRRLIAAMMRLSARMPSVKFITKLHPKDRIEYYRQVRHAVPDSRLMIAPPKSALASLPFDDWLQGCSAIVTGGSAAAIDAMLYDVPVVSVDLAEELLGISFIEYGATLHARSEEGLSLAVNAVLTGSERAAEVHARAREFVQGSFHELDGNPCEVAADILRRLIDASSTADHRLDQKSGLIS